MDKFFHSTFDFFSHAIPGFFILCSVFILDKDVQEAQCFFDLAGKMTIGSGVLLLITSYIIGFAMNPWGRWLYRRYGFRWFEHELHDDQDMFISDKFILIREFSPANFKYVETWNMFCAMAHNLAIASACVLVFSLVKLGWQRPPNWYFWLAIAAVSAVLFRQFLKRAVTFYKWAGDDLNAAVRVLELENRAKKAATTPPPSK